MGKDTRNNIERPDAGLKETSTVQVRRPELASISLDWSVYELVKLKYPPGCIRKEKGKKGKTGKQSAREMKLGN
jgi:hypothetical protein